jgi:hypothetical protein
MDSKDWTVGFLDRLKSDLENCLPPPSVMRNRIAADVTAAKKTGDKYRSAPERCFLNGYVIPRVFDVAKAYSGLENDLAREALLNEYYPGTPELSSKSPTRTKRHPFGKNLSVDPADIYQRWSKGGTHPPLTEVWPDFALQKPFPEPIVFEGKYYAGGSLATAQKQLVSHIYQAFFYRALPFLPPTSKGRAAWKYEFACLLAYDASVDGGFHAAWHDLPADVRTGFWDGANIYVMIIRPTE